MRFAILAIGILLTVLALLGCEVDRDKAMEILDAEGCTETQLEGWTMFGCGHDDNASQAFACVRNKTVVHGVICGQMGWFTKGYTVRYK